jgi:hypothetical protein
MELKDILSFTGIEADNIDDFKTKFQESFVNKTNAHADPDIRKKITKTVFVGQQNVFKKFFGENGIDTDSEEFTKAEKLEDYIRTGISKLSDAKQAELEELKSKVGATNDEIVKQKEAAIEQLKKKATDLETNWKKTAAELETERANFSTKLKENSIQNAINEARKQIKTKAKLSDVEKLGLDAALRSRLKFDLDETGKPYVTNDKGERIPSKAKASEFVSPVEAMQMVVDELNLNEVSPHGGKPAPAAGQGQQQQQAAPVNRNAPPSGFNTPKPHPSAAKAAGAA